jgi:hypothetical protein
LNSQDLKRKEEDHKSLEFYTIHLKNTTGIMINSLVLFTDGEPPKEQPLRQKIAEANLFTAW